MVTFSCNFFLKSILFVFFVSFKFRKLTHSKIINLFTPLVNKNGEDNELLAQVYCWYFEAMYSSDTCVPGSLYNSIIINNSLL